VSIDYLTEAEALHLVEVGGFAIRDVGLLLSAIARPQTTVYGMEAYQDLWTKAAALLES
jgi:death-on-curing protein